ncbi:MAG TPA: TetR family transcriptional regulator [Acidimicrobiia bacterium]|nr:TetR family transcriptional regulator [Acidimicrobiia bacterium]
MAKAGRVSRPMERTPATHATRQALVDGAIESLRHDGFGGASARAIAGRAGVNQSLVFYHFGSVAELLLAALDEVSARRLARYSAAVDGVHDPRELVAVAGEIFREDLDEGYVTVLVEMIAGAATSPELGAQVAQRLAPWRTFARDRIVDALAASPFAALLPVEDAAYAVVALYLGMEMLSHLDDDRAPARSLFDHAARFAAAFTAMPASEEDR